ncbi:hypothetical protein FNV43_RR13827 [Rhamnella rubrinervis]|uniref:3'-5' exonuclease domain-containing protein n=1 Tax=Rhamnella rubrinervis TaxID=2594499 RepID=A0A8K0H1P9_9ROSA|nr:hypothetical protein FNV43_RR13827 [Rhamnella rubrinervis]
MTMSIVDYELPYDTHNLYDVTLDTHQIHTLVTHTPSMVDTWFSDTLRGHHSTPQSLIVGIDFEWRPNFSRQVDNPIATLQLCIGNCCLIFQIMHAPSIPQSLIDFLGNAVHTFVGVGIQNDVEKLLIDYGFGVANMVDLGDLAARKLGVRELRNSGLKGLAKEVLGMEIVKPKRVTMSRWDTEWLTYDQVQYACIDAFLSYEIGRQLNDRV